MKILVGKTSGARLLERFLAGRELTQADAAERLGIDQSMLSKLVNGRRRPGRALANRISRFTEGAVPSAAWDRGKKAA